MSDDPPTGGESGDPFAGLGGIPVFGDLMRMLQGAQAGRGGQAQEVARAVATGGESEPNIDPADRIAVEQLLRVAELRVADATGLDAARGTPLQVEAVNRSQWANRTIRDYRTLFKALGESMTAGARQADDAPSNDPMAALLSGVTRVLGPMMLSLTIGASVGRLARRALGGYALPVPRPAGTALLVVLPNVNDFKSEWSLDADDLKLWVCLHEALNHAVFGVDHVRERISGLLQRYAAAFESSPRGLEELLSGFDPTEAGEQSWARLQAALGSPETILGAVRSEAQEALLPELTALLAAVNGYIDHTMDRIGSELIGSYSRLAEALRRQRVQVGASDRLVERLLGLELDREQYERGAAFAAGVTERAGPQGLQRLFTDPANLPTPNEVDAAGLWLARIDLPR